MIIFIFLFRVAGLGGGLMGQQGGWKHDWKQGWKQDTEQDWRQGEEKMMESTLLARFVVYLKH